MARQLGNIGYQILKCGRQGKKKKRWRVDRRFCEIAKRVASRSLKGRLDLVKEIKRAFSGGRAKKEKSGEQSEHRGNSKKPGRIRERNLSSCNSASGAIRGGHAPKRRFKKGKNIQKIGAQKKEMQGMQPTLSREGLGRRQP